MIAIGRPTYTPDADALSVPPPLTIVLSQRQCEVAVLIADHHLTNKQIAAHLNISHESVRVYVDRIARKLNVDRTKDIRTQIMRKVVDAWDEYDSAA